LLLLLTIEEIKAVFLTFLLTLKETSWNFGPKAFPPPLL
jgi:hypothetical protein